MNELATNTGNKPLTPAETRCFSFIELFTHTNGYAPSLREIAGAFGYGSMTSAHELVRSLEAKGKIRKVPGVARSIQILGAA